MVMKKITFEKYVFDFLKAVIIQTKYKAIIILFSISL